MSPRGAGACDQPSTHDITPLSSTTRCRCYCTPIHTHAHVHPVDATTSPSGTLSIHPTWQQPSTRTTHREVVRRTRNRRREMRQNSASKDVSQQNEEGVRCVCVCVCARAGGGREEETRAMLMADALPYMHTYTHRPTLHV